MGWLRTPHNSEFLPIPRWFDLGFRHTSLASLFHSVSKRRKKTLGSALPVASFVDFLGGEFGAGIAFLVSQTERAARILLGTYHRLNRANVCTRGEIQACVKQHLRNVHIYICSITTFKRVHRYIYINFLGGMAASKEDPTPLQLEDRIYPLAHVSDIY